MWITFCQVEEVDKTRSFLAKAAKHFQNTKIFAILYLCYEEIDKAKEG